MFDFFLLVSLLALIYSLCRATLAINELTTAVRAHNTHRWLTAWQEGKH